MTVDLPRYRRGIRGGLPWDAGGRWREGDAVLNWSNFVALGDSLTAGRDDHGPDGGRIGWPRRLAGLLSTRTAVRSGN
jgi:hypothetical protein